MAKNTYKLKCTVCGKRAKVTVDDDAPHMKDASSMADEFNNGWVAFHLCSKKCQKEHEAKQ